MMNLTRLLPLAIGLGVPALAHADLIAHYTFDTDASDSVGTNDGTLGTGASIQSADTAFTASSGALRLDGAAGINREFGVSTLEDLHMDPNNLEFSPITVAYWAKVDADQGDAGGAAFFTIAKSSEGANTGGGPGQRLELLNSTNGQAGTHAPGHLRVELNGNGAGGGDLDLTGSFDSTDGWHHYAVRLSANAPMSTIELFIDGASVGNPGTGNDPAFNMELDIPYALHIGSTIHAAGQRALLGYMDDFRLYDESLSDEDIMALANPGGGGLSADFNMDGTVDLLDLDILGANWEMAGTAATGDANGDAVVDLLDLDLLGAQWEQTASFASALAASGIAVPEPASLALTLAGAMLIARRRRV